MTPRTSKCRADVCITCCACSYGYYVSLAWLPSYFQLGLGLNIESSSLYTLIPYLVSYCAGSTGAGCQARADHYDG